MGDEKDFKYAAVWRGKLIGEWTEAYPEEESHWRCEINLAFIIPDIESGADLAPLSGEARVVIQQPFFVHHNPNITRVTAQVSPLRYTVGFTGSISVKGSKFTFYPDAEPSITASITYYPKEGEPTTWRGEWMTGVLWLFEELSYVEQDDQPLKLALSARRRLEGYTVRAAGEITASPVPNEVAMVTNIVGEAKVTRYGREEELVAGYILNYEDTITVGAGSSVELNLLDGSIVRLDERTKLQVGVNLFQEEEVTLKVLLGRMWANIKPTTLKKERAFRTPTAVDAIRGTQFTVDVAGDGATTLTVIEGLVEISDLEETKRVLVGSNEATVVEPDGTPSDPESVDPLQLDKWWASADTPMPSPTRTSEPDLRNYTFYPIVLTTIIIIMIALTLLKKRAIRGAPAFMRPVFTIRVEFWR